MLRKQFILLCQLFTGDVNFQIDQQIYSHVEHHTQSSFQEFDCHVMKIKEELVRFKTLIDRDW
jgi:hypothetical protein